MRAFRSPEITLEAVEADMILANDDGYRNAARGAGEVVVNSVRNNNGENDDGLNDSKNTDIAVETKGRALEVRAGDKPHLVSLGSDRFSTTVTLFPILKGQISIGSGSSTDILIHGTGVEKLHCWIENNGEIVIVHPNGENVPIQVDGLKVSQPTRLTQGCMLCLGRSNFFRFNHPQEARYMKSVLPNIRVSIMPNAFCPINQSDDVSVSESKISSESRRSYESPDSWCEISSGTSSEDLLNSSARNDIALPFSKHISPKVFLPGSSILNSPASVVLGRHKFPGNSTSAKSPFYNSVTVYEDKVERNFDGSDDQLPNIHCNDRNNNFSIRNDNRIEDKNNVKFNSSESLSPKQKIVPPSPAFNRNPSYFNSKCSSPTNDYNSFSSSPMFSSSPKFLNGNLSISKIDKNGSLSSPTGSYDSIGSFNENGLRKNDPDMKRKQAHQNRILEQERERVERLRLEEILTACADYEKQAQYDRFNKPQVRIKTNGSLPRDKQCLLPLAKTPDSSKNGLIFNFDKHDVLISSSDYHLTNGEKPSYLNSPRTRIKTVASPKITRKDYTLEILENKIAIINDYEVLNLMPVFERTNKYYEETNEDFGVKHSYKANGTRDIYETLKSKSYENNRTRENNSNKSSPAVDNKTLRKYEFLGIDPTTISKTISNKMDIMSCSYHESFLKENDARESSSCMSTSLINFSDENSSFQSSNFSSNDYAKSKSQSFTKINDNGCKNDGIEKLNGLVSELNELVKDSSCNNLTANEKMSSSKIDDSHRFILPLDEVPYKEKESKFILPLEEIDCVLRRQRFSMKKCELKKLQNEQSRLMDAINNVKTKLLDIQQQKDEIIRELEMEKALLEGELKSENGKLVSQEQFLNDVQEKINQCEKQIDICSKQQIERQNHNKSIVKEQQNILNVLQSNLACIKNEDDKASIIESIEKSREILEDETKSFEDFEFRLLEEEATLLSKRDELHSELSKINNSIDHTRSKISGLYSQKEQLLQNASDEIKSLELQVHCHNRTLQRNHNRLQDISVQLKETSKSLSEISEDANESCEETYSCKTQSQEDLDRISRVTSDAPIMESGSTNSLGRRTIASLQQIERNRQLHLAQQGSHVIEEERKRMLALKRRVQDEVKARWEEEKKQRDNNCSSITSIGSDNSSMMSSDRVTESPSSEDKLLANGTVENGYLVEDGNAGISKSAVQKDDKDDDRSTKSKRPSNAASIAKENGIMTNLRMKSTGLNHQRPYSVYKRESLDLRQHIESAGHQVDHCPHVFVDKTSCRGYLQKMTTKFRAWNKRWFVFDRKKCSFTYYSDKSEKKLKGGAYFQGLLDLCIDNSNSVRSTNPQATFIVKSTERTYYLLAPSIEAMRIWFDVLATEVETYQDT